MKLSMPTVLRVHFHKCKCALALVSLCCLLNLATAQAQVSALIFFVPEKRLAVAGMFNLEGIPGPERIALGEAIADAVFDETTPNPDHFSRQESNHAKPRSGGIH